MSQEVPKLYYNQKITGQSIDPLWWNQKEEGYRHMLAVARAIEDDQRYRSTANLKHARLYANMDIRGLAAYQYSRISTALPPNRVTLNVGRACVDTAAAKIAKNRPRVLFLTEKGEATLQRKAKKLTQFVDGTFDAADVYPNAQLAFVEGGVFGTGAVKIYEEDAVMKTARIPIDEVIVDDADGMYCKPRSMYHRQWIHRDTLISKYPDKADILKRETKTAATENITAPESAGNEMLYVVEGWHLPSGKDAKDGRHIIAVDSGVLADEQWDRDYFPFAFFRWAPRLLGFYGSGIIEEIIGIQLEINKILKDFSESIHLFARPRILQKAGTAVTKDFTNQIGARYWYEGEKPEFWIPNAMAPDVVQHLWNLFQRAFEIVGISQLSAMAKKPAGLDAAVAIREYNDIETERFSLVGQRWEEFHLDIARILVAEMRYHSKQDKKFIVKAPGTKFLETIPWTEVDLEETKFSMRTFPTNLLPSQPAGKMQRVKEMTEAGYIEKEMAMQLLDFPDVDKFISLATAAVEDVQLCIEQMLEKGKAVTPEPFMNLPMALRLTQSAYLKARTENVEEERLELLRSFMSKVMDLMNATAPAPAPVPQPAAPQPGPAPAPAQPGPAPAPGLPLAA